MKKFFLSMMALLMSAITTSVSAQAIMNDDSFPWRFGIQLGFNVPSFAEDQYSATIGWNFGATALYDLQNFIPNSYARGSVLYSRKGTSFDSDDIKLKERVSPDMLKDGTCYLHYLEMPIRFGYAYELNDITCLLAETGPYFGLRMWSSLRADDSYSLGKGEESLGAINGKMKDYYKDLRTFDSGWGIHVGVLLDKKYQFLGGCDWGLRSPVHNKTGRNLNWTIGATVYFD